jgi:hypothetical protein
LPFNVIVFCISSSPPSKISLSTRERTKVSIPFGSSDKYLISWNISTISFLIRSCYVPS